MQKSNDWSDLELFEHVGEKVGSPDVNITDKKIINLSKGFLHYAVNELDNKTHVHLMYSKSNHCIVLNFSSEKGLKLIKYNKPYDKMVISARSFFNYYMIDAEETAGKYVAVLEEIPNIGKQWVIYLNKRRSKK